jgi:hypothetical protein
MLDWMGRKECVGYVGNLEEMWLIKRQEQEKDWHSSKKIGVSF